MTDKDIVKALETLAERGWAVSVKHDEVTLSWSDGTCWSGELLPLDDPERALVMGWLVAQIEARGLRREVKYGYDQKPWVQICSLDGHALDWGGWGETEFEALLAACLALGENFSSGTNKVQSYDRASATPADSETPTTAATEYPTFDDPAVQSVSADEREGDS